MSSGEVNRKRINFTNDMISNKGLQDSSAKWIPKNSILVALAGQGKTRGMVATNNVPITTNQSIAAIVPNNELYYEFIYQNLTNKYRQLRLISSGDGTRGGLNKKIISNIDIIIPKFHEQKKIGDFLLSIDNLIFEMNSRLTMYESLKKYMLQNLFPNNGKKVPNVRFADFSGDWEQHKLGDVFQTIKNAFVGTATPYYVDQDQGGYFYLESNNVKNGKINKKSEVFINKEFYYNQKYNWLKTNDLVMVQSGHVGHTAVIPRELNNTAAHALIMFKNKRIDLNSNFLNYAFQTDKSKKKLNIISIGNTIKHILSSDMKTFKIYQPITVKEQDEIAKLILNIDRIITLHKKQLTMYENLKKYYMQKLFI